MPLSVEAWDAGTSHLTDAEDGLYGRLVRALWQMPNQRFPNDDAWLARRFRRTVEDVRTGIRPLFEEFFQTDGNWITHKRVSREFKRARRTTKQRSEAAKARWNKEKTSYESNAEKQNPAVILTHTHTHTHTPTIEEPPIAPPKGGATEEPANGKRTTRKSRLPADWEPDADDRAYAEKHGRNPEPAAENFRDYWIGRGEPMADWKRVWQRYCRSSIDRDPPGKRNGGAPSHAGRYPSGGRQTDGSITGALAFLARQRAENGDDS